jgi:hypothetical protein
MPKYLILLLLAGCSSQYDDCMEKERTEYRQRNPDASHSHMSQKQRDFETICSSVKNK